MFPQSQAEQQKIQRQYQRQESDLGQAPRQLAKGEAASRLPTVSEKGE